MGIWIIGNIDILGDFIYNFVDEMEDRMIRLNFVLNLSEMCHMSFICVVRNYEE